MPQFQEIEALNNLIKSHSIKIEILSNSDFFESWFLVQLSIKNQTFKIHVDDEFNDFKINSPALHLCLVLRSLEELKDAKSFESWCKATCVPKSNEAAFNYFLKSDDLIKEIELIIGPIDSKTSDFDFTLNADAAQFLRTN